MPTDQPDQIFKLVLVGDSGVGKSCLLKRCTSDTFSTKSQSTIGVDFMIKFITTARDRTKLTMWDTAGMSRFQELTRRYYDGSHGVMLVYDVTRRQTLQDLEKSWMYEVNAHNSFDKAVKIVVGNKVDLSAREVTREDGLELARRHGCLFAETSAKDDVGVKEAFESLANAMKQVPELMEDARKKAESRSKTSKRKSVRQCCSRYGSWVDRFFSVFSANKQ